MLQYLVCVILCSLCVLSKNPHEHYEDYDKDGNGGLSKDEFQYIFLQFDTSNDGNITKQEFVTGWHDHHFHHEDHATFDFFELDRNDDQLVTADPDLEYLFRFFDDDADMSISKPEYTSNWEALFHK